MSFTRRDIEIVAGCAYDHTLYLGTDVSADTFDAELRQDPTAVGAADATFAIDSTDAATGVIVLSLEAADTDGLDPAAVYWWDIVQTIDTRPTPLYQGRVTVAARVTQ